MWQKNCRLCCLLQLFAVVFLVQHSVGIVFDPDDEVFQTPDSSGDEGSQKPLKNSTKTSAKTGKTSTSVRDEADNNKPAIYNADLAASFEAGTIIDLAFAENFDLFDPHNVSGRSNFRFTSYNVIADFDAAENGPRMLDNFEIRRDLDANLVRLSASPFKHWLPQSQDLDAVLAAYEAAVAPVDAIYPIGSKQTLSVQLRFTCQCHHTNKHKFPAEAVTNANDDMRLASCNFALSNSNTHDEDGDTGLEFGIAATNKGIWATYNRVRWVRTLDNATYGTFEIRRRLANRLSPSDIIDASIEIDRFQGQTRYYVDDKLLWTVGQWGVLTKEMLDDDKNRLVSYTPPRTIDEQTQTSTTAVQPSSFFLYIANTHLMDVGDALLPKKTNDANILSLVKYADPPGYYTPDQRFADEHSSKTSSIFGQGAEIGLQRLVVKRQTSQMSFKTEL